MAGAIEASFGRARLALIGMATAGLYSSSMGELLTTRIGFLSREIASLFIPQIQAAIRAIERVTEWFRKLSGDQQENIGRWLLAGAAALSVAKIMPGLIGGIMGAVGAVRSLTVAIIGLESSTGIGALLPILGAAITAFASLFIAVEIGRNGFGRFWAMIQPILTNLGSLFTKVVDALGPMAAAFQESFDALMPPLMELVKALGELLVPLVRTFGAEWAIIIKLMTPLVKVFLEFATVLVTVVTPALKVVAANLEMIAKVVAFLTGTKFDISPKKKEEDTKPHQSLGARMGGFESLTSAWERVAKSTIGIGLGGAPKKTTDDVVDKLDEIKELITEKADEIDVNSPIAWTPGG